MKVTPARANREVHSSERSFSIKLKLCTLLFLLFSAATGKAQDPRFTQYFTAPLNLNPALAGKGVADWRVLSTYRTQRLGGGVAAYSTYALSLEKNVLTTSNGSVLGAGIQLLTDASNNGLLKTTYVAGSLAYNLAVATDGKQLLGAGLQFAYGHRSVDPSKLVYQDGTSGTTDYLNAATRIYADVNAGLHYSYLGNRSSYHLGVSYYHINTPDQQLSSSGDIPLQGRLSLQAGYDLKFAGNNALELSSIYEHQGSSNLYSVGGVFKLGLSSELLHHLTFGLWERYGNSISPYFGVEGLLWSIGISTDVKTVSSPAQPLESFEISGGWQLGKKAKTETSKNVFIY